MSASPTFGPTADSASGTIEALRARHQVRPLNAQEEGQAAHALPAGVYGYTYSPGLDQVPIFAQKKYHTFEVHRAIDGAEYLIGFATAAEAAEIELAKEGALIRLFPDPWEDAQSLVSVPVSRMHASKKSLPREDGNPFAFTIA